MRKNRLHAWRMRFMVLEAYADCPSDHPADAGRRKDAAKRHYAGFQAFAGVMPRFRGGGAPVAEV